VCAWLLSPAGPRQVQVRVWGVLWPLAGVFLTLKQDQHGPPLLVGFAVSRPAQSRRDRGTTALILGFFGFVLRRVIGRGRRSLRAGAGGGMVLP
jgi:hypothetical protein